MKTIEYKKCLAEIGMNNLESEYNTTNNNKGVVNMSSTDGNGRGNLLVSYIFKSDSITPQIKEELELKRAISQALLDRCYKFIIFDDRLIDERLIAESDKSVGEIK